MTTKNPATIDAQRHEENSQRIARLESSLTTMSEQFSNFTREVKSDFGRVEDAIGRISVQQAGSRSMNWPAAGVAVAAFGLLTGFAAFAINSTNERVRHEREERMILAERVDRTIEREQERNNRIERELGGVMKVNDLFAAGRLNLSSSGTSHP